MGQWPTFFQYEYFIIWMGHHLFIHLPTKGHLGWLQGLANMNKASINFHGWFWCRRTNIQLLYVGLTSKICHQG